MMYRAPLRQPQVMGIALWFLLVGVGFVPLFAASAPPFLPGLIALMSVNLIGLARSLMGPVRPVQQLFWVFNLSWITFPASYQLVAGGAAWGDYSRYSEPGLVNRSLGLYALLLAAYLLGEAIIRNRGTREIARVSAFRSINDAQAGEPRVIRRLLIAAWVVWSSSMVLLPLVISQSGGVQGLFSTRTERAVAFRESGLSLAGGDGPLIFLSGLFPSGLATVCIVLAILVVKPRSLGLRSRSVTAGRVVFLTVMSLPGFLYCNPFSNSRFVTLTYLGVVALYALAPRSRRDSTALVGVSLVALLVLYPAASVFRSVVSASNYRFSLTDQLSTADFDGFQQIVNTVDFVDAGAFGGGNHILSGLLVFVPRSIWPGKATPASIEVATYRGYDFTNLSLPLPAELYLDLGLVGALVAMIAIGWGSGLLDHRWVTRQPMDRLAAIAPLVALTQIGLIRGPLGSQMPLFLAIVVTASASLTWAIRRPAVAKTPSRNRLANV